MTSPLFRQEAVEHQRNRLFGEALVAWPISFKLMTAAAVLAGGMFIAFAVWGDYTRKVRVNGYLAPTRVFVKVHAREVATITGCVAGSPWGRSGNCAEGLLKGDFR